MKALLVVLAITGAQPATVAHVEEIVDTAEPSPIVVEKPEPEPQPAPVDDIWERLAECESGNWVDGGASFEQGSARWDWAKPGTTIPPWGTSIHHGGLQFHPDTWNWVAPMVSLGHIDYAYNATRAEQVTVAKKVQELQGWGAWPVCSQKLGLR